jgi:hypothetical protein
LLTTLQWKSGWLPLVSEDKDQVISSVQVPDSTEFWVFCPHQQTNIDKLRTQNNNIDVFFIILSQNKI